MINMHISTFISTCKLLRLRAPTGWLLLGLPGSWILLHGNAGFSLWLLWWTGAFLARSVGCVINDWIDQDIDKHVKRTQHRPFASGELGYRAFILLTLLLGTLALIVAHTLHPDVFITCCYIIPWIVLYPLSKRWLIIPQLFLAPVFAYSIVVAHVIMPEPQWFPWYCACCFWILGYDTVYGLSDKEDDAALGIYSAPLTLGAYTQIFVALCYGSFFSIIYYILPIHTASQALIYIIISFFLSSQIFLLNAYRAQWAFHSNTLVGTCVCILILLNK